MFTQKSACVPLTLPARVNCKENPQSKKGNVSGLAKKNKISNSGLGSAQEPFIGQTTAKARCGNSQQPAACETGPHHKVHGKGSSLCAQGSAVGCSLEAAPAATVLQGVERLKC